MSTDISKSFESYCGDLQDPRIERSKLYPLSEILFVVLSGSVCGTASWRDFVLFGEERPDFLQEYYAFENGTQLTTARRLIFQAHHDFCEIRFIPASH